MTKITFDKTPNARSKEQFEPFEVAELEFEFEGTLLIDGEEVDAAGVEYVLGYGLKQALADSYAAFTTLDKAEKAFNSRLEKIMSGQIVAGQRSGDPIMQAMKALALKALCAHLKMSETKVRETYKDGQLAKLVDKVIAMNRDDFEARAKIIVAESKANEGIVLDGLFPSAEPVAEDEPEGDEAAKEELQPVPAKKGKRAKAA